MRDFSGKEGVGVREKEEIFRKRSEWSKAEEYKGAEKDIRDELGFLLVTVTTYGCDSQPHVPNPASTCCCKQYLLEHSLAHVFTDGLWLLLYHSARVGKRMQTLRYMQSGPVQKKSAHLCSRTVFLKLYCVYKSWESYLNGFWFHRSEWANFSEFLRSSQVMPLLLDSLACFEWQGCKETGFSWLVLSEWHGESIWEWRMMSEKAPEHLRGAWKHGHCWLCFWRQPVLLKCTEIQSLVSLTN